MIDARRLPSGWWHIRGNGPCNWAQPPYWPCDEAMLRKHSHPEASDQFVMEAAQAARRIDNGDNS